MSDPVKLTVLVCDDEPAIRGELREYLEDRGRYRVLEASRPSEAFARMAEEQIDIVILDVNLPERDGIEVLDRLKKDRPGLEVLMITGRGETETVLRALRAGASDFFFKPLSLPEIERAIGRTRRVLELNEALRRTEEARASASELLKEELGSEIVGKSPAMRKVVELATRAAASRDTAALIVGPSGTGKELVARLIHNAGSRKTGPLRVVNCSAIPENLVESELFGHVRGSFTGATSDRVGAFEAADGGTIFLDEIGDMPPALQSRLLRACEEKTVRPVGGTREKPVDVRVIAATHRDLEALVAADRFRLDLYHRLNTVEIRIPSLRERPEDIPPLVDHFLRHFARKFGRKPATLSLEALARLGSYEFPGNVRELRNIIERAIILCDGETLDLEHFPLRSRESGEVASEAGDLDLARQERRLIAAALERAKGNKTEAARLLGISWFALDRKLKKNHEA